LDWINGAVMATVKSGKSVGDTLVKTLRKTYGPDFAPGVRSDTRLDTLRKRAGGESLSKILKD
jgi:hypothetical protein